MPRSRPIFRVSFTGPVLESSVLKAALDGEDLRWEGSWGDVDEPIRHHRALVGAVSADEAIATVREALATLGYFGDFHAAPVRDARGDAKRTPIRRWEDVDWGEVQGRVSLTELQRSLLGTFLNAAEPTWIIVKDPDVQHDLYAVEAALRDLERRRLVYSKIEESGETGREYAADNWCDAVQGPPPTTALQSQISVTRPHRLREDRVSVEEACLIGAWRELWRAAKRRRVARILAALSRGHMTPGTAPKIT